MMWAMMILASASAPAAVQVAQGSAGSVEIRGYVPASCGASIPDDGTEDARLQSPRLRCNAAMQVSYTRGATEDAPVRVLITPL